MTEDELIGAIQALVAAGEHLDHLPGLARARPDGGVVGGLRPVLYMRGSPEHLRARAAGLTERLPPPTPAPPAAVQAAEGVLGRRLPALLRRVYLEVGNGGFGPGYGLLGVDGGYGKDRGRTAMDRYRQAQACANPARRSRLARLLPICSWGCAVSSLIDLADGRARMWAWDPTLGHDGGLFGEALTFAAWLERWVDGRLDQPDFQGPQTGPLPGDTDADEAVMPEADWIPQQ